MADTEKQDKPVGYRGRRPSVETLVKRVTDLGATVETFNKRTSARKIKDAIEEATLLHHHLTHYGENGEDVKAQVETTTSLMSLELPVKKVVVKKATVKRASRTVNLLNPYASKIKELRERKEVLLREIEDIDSTEYALYVEVGQAEIDRQLA